MVSHFASSRTQSQEMFVIQAFYSRLVTLSWSARSSHALPALRKNPVDRHQAESREHQKLW